MYPFFCNYHGLTFDLIHCKFFGIPLFMSKLLPSWKTLNLYDHVIQTNQPLFSNVFLIPILVCSHQDIDVSHPEFFSAQKLNGYVPPNKEVMLP